MYSRSKSLRNIVHILFACYTKGIYTGFLISGSCAFMFIAVHTIQFLSICLITGAPIRSPVENVLQSISCSRRLKSGDFLIPRTRLKTYDQRSLATSEPIAWNSLPLHLKTEASLSFFKSRLKTHLFICCYN